MPNKNTNKTAVVTGACGGLGLALTRLLADRGWRVFAADCDERGLAELADEPNVEPILIDVTNSESVAEAAASVSAGTVALDAVVNFAGILRVGSLIEVEESLLQRVLDINLMGTYRVNKAFFPLLSEGDNKGRIVNVSSETGWHTASPFNGPYAMSKYGIEAYSDALRRELSLYDVPVICVQPGPFKTELVADTVDGFSQAAAGSGLYSRQLEHFGELVREANKKAHDPSLLAEVIYSALTDAKPKSRYSVKADRGRSFLEWLPMSVADGIFKKMLANPQSN